MHFTNFNIDIMKRAAQLLRMLVVSLVCSILSWSAFAAGDMPTKAEPVQEVANSEVKSKPTHARTRARSHTRTQVRTYARAHTHTHTHTRTHAHTPARTT